MFKRIIRKRSRIDAFFESSTKLESLFDAVFIAMWTEALSSEEKLGIYMKRIRLHRVCH